MLVKPCAAPQPHRLTSNRWHPWTLPLFCAAPHGAFAGWTLTRGAAARIVLRVKPLGLNLLMVVAVAAGGCGAAARGWEESSLPTHDREKAFEAARKVLSQHFELAESNWARGEIRTRPQFLDRQRTGTLADVRGAGGRWRSTALCEIGRDGMTIIARVAVRMEREATAAAVAMAETGTDDRASDVPRSVPRIAEPGAKADREVWVEMGYDRPMARELLAQIAEEVQKSETREALPPDQSPDQILEESRRIGAEQDF